VSAGNQLFHILVDTDDIAARLSAMLKKEQAGRVTFIPLNQVRSQNVTYPNVGDDALPLVKKLRFDARFKDAVHQVSAPLMLFTIFTSLLAIPHQHDHIGRVLGGICKQVAVDADRSAHAESVTCMLSKTWRD
jgi:chromosome segregation ATPase